VGDYLHSHHLFHRRVAELTGYRMLSQAIDTTNALITTWVAVSLTSSQVCAHHAELAFVLASESPERAAFAMRKHVNDANHKVIEALEPYFLTWASGTSGGDEEGED